jgi:hypothetical protein
MVPVSVTIRQVRQFRDCKVRLSFGRRRQATGDSGIGDPEQVPLAIALLFDISSSTSQKGFSLRSRKQQRRFCRLVMKPADKAAIFTITDKRRWSNRSLRPRRQRKDVDDSGGDARVPTLSTTPSQRAKYLTDERAE